MWRARRSGPSWARRRSSRYVPVRTGLQDPEGSPGAVSFFRRGALYAPERPRNTRARPGGFRAGTPHLSVLSTVEAPFRGAGNCALSHGGPAPGGGGVPLRPPVPPLAARLPAVAASFRGAGNCAPSHGRPAPGVGGVPLRPPVPPRAARLPAAAASLRGAGNCALSHGGPAPGVGGVPPLRGAGNCAISRSRPAPGKSPQAPENPEGLPAVPAGSPSFHCATRDTRLSGRPPSTTSPCSGTSRWRTPPRPRGSPPRRRSPSC